ncbi:MAG TPA: ATP-binding protein [Alphaproteobacteria bacterium]|nr:ATP-binding protein [Alphaproteobacteria bacterium]
MTTEFQDGAAPESDGTRKTGAKRPASPPGLRSGGLLRGLVRRIRGAHRGMRLVWAFSLVSAAAIWLVFALYAAREHARIYDVAARELLGAQNVLRAHARRTYESTQAMLAVIDNWLVNHSNDLLGSEHPLSELKVLIDSLQAFDEEPVAVRLIDPAGYMFRVGPRDSSNVSIYVGDRDYIAALKEARPGTHFMAAPTVSRDSGRYVLPMAVKMHPNNFGVAYAVAAVSAAHFSKAYENLLVTAPAKLGLVKSDGTVLFTWPEDMRISGHVVPGVSDRLGNQLSGDRGLLDLPSIDGSGRRTLTGFAALARAPLVVFAAFERRDLDLIWLSNIVPGFVVCLAATAATLAFAFAIGRMMRRDSEKTLALQAALFQANAADKAKRNFLASMSHELRTPLNAIIGFADIMRTEAFGPLGSARYRDYSGDIAEAGRHLLAVIHDILDTARIEQGHIQRGRAPLDVAAAIGQTLTLMEPAIRAKNIAIARAIDGGLPAVVMDKAHLQQVLFNILGNAVKFSPPGATIRVAAHLAAGPAAAEMAAAGAGEMPAGAVEIVIADEGGGIPAHRIGELFRPFSKIDEGYVRNTEGIGLGLANSKLIVEAYGGRIALESELGQGTRVTITLPLDPAAPPAPAT